MARSNGWPSNHSPSINAIPTLLFWLPPVKCSSAFNIVSRFRSLLRSTKPDIARIIATAELDSATITEAIIAAEDPVSCINHPHDRLLLHNLSFFLASAPLSVERSGENDNFLLIVVNKCKYFRFPNTPRNDFAFWKVFVEVSEHLSN